MTDLIEQLNSIRQEKHLAYLRHTEAAEAMERIEANRVRQEKNGKRISELMPYLSEKYRHIFNPNPKLKAVATIQRFVRKHYFRPECINSHEIRNIPAIYRFRVNITDNHFNEYFEENIGDDMLQMHRLIYKMTMPAITVNNNNVIFRYCFDIRKLYLQRHQIIELYDQFYFMQPDDHARILKCWNKVNGETDHSIRYLNNLEYIKSLSIDQNKDVETEIAENNENEFDTELVEGIIKKYMATEV